jgi:peptidoglycan hydrolase CwlO-like protein
MNRGHVLLWAKQYVRLCMPVFVVVCMLFVLLSGFPKVFAQDINELKQKISELQGQENTFSKQIAIMDSQISMTQIRIQSTKTAIDKLGTEITQLAGEIDRLEGVLTRRSELVLRRIPESYKRNSTPLLAALFLSRDFSDLLYRIKYVTSVEQEDAQLMFQLKATQNNFSERKDLRESKKKQQEQLKTQLVQESADLDVQKGQKQTLLEQTKSSEAVYQKLLAQALAEQQAVEAALINGVKIGPVKKGDPIALVGNTGYPGCSTGAHLHFEVRRNNSWINAEDLLTRKNVHDDQNGGNRDIGNGSWDWPLSGDIVVTQRYGRTPYSWRYTYSGGIHTGVDMVSNTSAVIRAPADGNLFSSSQSCGGSSTIKIKYLEHGDGLVSFYLHVQ